MKRYISALFVAMAATAPLSLPAQVSLDFETPGAVKSLSIYDCWEQSPFRTGELKGNFKVVDNPQPGVDPISGLIPNSSAKVLGAQRSRFGSNTFGVRIDLATPFDFSTSRKYLHVNILRPVSGRMMVVGLGRRRDWADQPADVEQFWVLTRSNLIANSWCDAVFELEGPGGVDIHSLVIVPECESPHAATEDFLFYVDNITLSSSDTPTIKTPEPYAIRPEKNANTISTANYLGSISFTSSDGEQILPVDQQTTRLLYRYANTMALTARPGDKVTLTPRYTGTGMNAYLYLDLDNNGRFDIPEEQNGTTPAGRDLLAYSHLNGKNSLGQTADANSTTLPSFTIPADLKPGAYRMRLKMEENCADPAGLTAEYSTLLRQGSFTDMVLFVHNGTATLNDFQLNGEVLAADGSKLSAYTTPAGLPFDIRMNPEKGFRHNGVKVVYGFNIDSPSPIGPNGNVQYLTVALPFSDATYTLPGRHIFGNVRVEGQMIEDKGETFIPIDPSEYGLNFAPDLAITRSDRTLNSVTFTVGGVAKTFTPSTSPKTVYQNLTAQGPLVARRGDRVETSVNYSGNSMHVYQYVDWNRDRRYDNTLDSSGRPAGTKELVAYTYYRDHNSLGQTLGYGIDPHGNHPFTIPADLPYGIYNARLKIDWDNIDPKGQYGSGNSIERNGGYIIDFYIQVDDPNGNPNSVTLPAAPVATLDILPTPGGVLLTSPSTVDIAVHDLSGRLIARRPSFRGTARLPLPTGLYLINGQKLAVR